MVNKETKVFIITLNYDLSSTPGSLMESITGVYLDEKVANKECKRLNKEIKKQVMEENECKNEDDLEYLSDFEWDGYDLSQCPFYHVEVHTIK